MDILRSLINFAYEKGFHELGYDPLNELVSQLGGQLGNDCCENKAQCWEPCGDLGKSELHASTSTGSTSEPFTTQEAWRAAITLANNICVQESNRVNDDDGPLEAVHMAAECAKRVRGWLEPTDDQLDQLISEATGRPVPLKSQRASRSSE